MQENKEGILALDFGTKRVGMAISHGFVAEAIGSLVYKDNEEAFLAQVANVVEEQKVSKLVVGLPLRNSEESEQSQWTREQAEKLSSVLNLEIYYVDEAYSTTQAAGEIDKNGDIDSQSAKIILEQFLAQNESATD